MRPAYSRIAWGLALELIDFRIQSFDILPDALGYLLIMIGLAGVRPRNGKFIAGWLAAGALLLESLPRLVGGLPILNLLEPQALDFYELLMMAGIALVEMMMLYGICIGIREQSLSEERHAGLAHSALRTWQAVFGFGASMLIALPFTQTTQWSTMLPWTFVLGLGSFIAGLWVIALVRRAGKQNDKGSGTEGKARGMDQVTVKNEFGE